MKILLIDDDIQSLNSIRQFLSDPLGHDVVAASSCEKGLKLYKESDFDTVITDIRMPGMNGIDLLREIKKLPTGNFCDVILMTGFGELETCMEALRLGASDYLLKPIYVSHLSHVLQRLTKLRQLKKENTNLKSSFDNKLEQSTMHMRSELDRYRNIVSVLAGHENIGIFSEQMNRIAELCIKFHREPDVPVLIEGETGTGKEVLAALIHNGKGKSLKPFVPLNCSAIATTLFESELFGYEKGAFTGAKKEGYIGKLELARGGTLFLDEIGDMPLEMQPKLLRVIQEKEMYRIGGTKKIYLNNRLIFATNRDLLSMVKEKSFREDLFYRINTGHIRIPPLRERKQEIAPLALMFLRKASMARNRKFEAISRDAVHLMENYSWPGNVRELKSTIERIVLLHNEKIILPEHLSFLFTGKFNNDNHSTININFLEEQMPLKDIEFTIARKVLQKFNGNISKSAQYLNIAWATFAKMARLKD